MKNLQSEVLNLSDDMVRGLIVKVEQSVFELCQSLENKLPNLQEAEQLYFPLKNEFDSIKESLEKEKQTLSCLIGFRDNENLRKNIRVLRSVTNSDKSKKERNKRYNSLEAAINVLEQTQMFLTPDILVAKIFLANPTWTIIFNRSTELREKQKIKYSLVYQAKGKMSANPKLLLHNNKLGLASWFDSNNVPLPKFLKSVMEVTNHA